MHARVTAILVARTGAAYLGRTLPALAAQTRRPDAFIAVDAGSSDSSAELLAASAPSLFVSARAQAFGSAVDRALQVADPASDDDEWLWLLAHDNAPEPRALELLLGAVEIAPSVAIAGPKLMRWQQQDVIDGFGETMTRFGASIPMVDGELDQAQHDVQDDVLAVAAGGMLVRRSLFVALGGFDEGLPSVDAALDFSVRARLAGFRVVGVPGARVATAGGLELFGRRSVTPRRRARVARAAQLHRRLVYAPPLAVPFHWLSLLPLALLRAIGQLLAQRPGFVGGEFAAALSAAFTGGVGSARTRLRRTKRLGWASIAPLRMPPRDVRERRAQAREAVVARGEAAEPIASFVSNGGLWVVVLTAFVGAFLFGPLLGAQSLTGGGLLPLSDSVGQLWGNVGYGWRDIGVGFVGASDPFAYVLAVLGSITFWSPSFSVVLLFILAMPLAALGAWFAARRLTTRTALPVIAALLWAVAPPLLGSLTAGHLGAVIAHLLLPWLVLAALNATRSWAASATAALLLAAVAASAPALAPALIVCWFAWLVANPTNVVRLIGIPIPAIALFAPLVIQQFARGNPLALLAEPGVPVAGGESTGWQLALASSAPGLNGWTAALAPLTLPGAGTAIVVAVLVAPLALIALLGLFVPGSRRAVPALAVALLGFATAVIGSRIEVAIAGTVPAAIWPAAALSLFWLGLIGAALVGLDAVGRVAIPLAVLASVTTVALAVPMLVAFYTGVADVTAGSGRILPALVTAEAQQRPEVGTLVLDPGSGEGIGATLERGAGTTLDDQSTLAATSTVLGAAKRAIAVIAGNLASRSGLDSVESLGRYSIGFIVLEPGIAGSALHQRAADALDGNPALSAVGETSNGLLWRVERPGFAAIASHPSNTATATGRIVVIGQAIIFGLTLLLGIPTSRRRRRTTVSGSAPEEPAGTFDEDGND
jgi:GT2 family glycosyltransferase